MNSENEVHCYNTPNIPNVLNNFKTSLGKVKKTNKSNFPYLRDIKQFNKLNEEDLVKKLSENSYNYLFNSLESAILACKNNTVKYFRILGW
jgi:hypothetical protein